MYPLPAATPSNAFHSLSLKQGSWIHIASFAFVPASLSSTVNVSSAFQAPVAPPVLMVTTFTFFLSSLVVLLAQDVVLHLRPHTHFFSSFLARLDPWGIGVPPLSSVGSCVFVRPPSVARPPPLHHFPLVSFASFLRVWLCCFLLPPRSLSTIS